MAEQGRTYDSPLDYNSLYSEEALPRGYYLVRHELVKRTKDVIISILRAIFSEEEVYTYVGDENGFPVLPVDGVEHEDATQIVISDHYKYEVKLLPAIIVTSGNINNHEVSFNQNAHANLYELDIDPVDGYDDVTGEAIDTVHRRPLRQVYSGAWDQTMNVTIATEDTLSREELTDMISILFMNILRDELWSDWGIFVKGLSVGAETEEEYANDHVYLSTIALDIFSEWRREIPIPISNIISTIKLDLDVIEPSGSAITELHGGSWYLPEEP
jgi:hypothetical protein